MRFAELNNQLCFIIKFGVFPYDYSFRISKLIHNQNNYNKNELWSITKLSSPSSLPFHPLFINDSKQP